MNFGDLLRSKLVLGLLALLVLAPFVVLTPLNWWLTGSFLVGLLFTGVTVVCLGLATLGALFTLVGEDSVNVKKVTDAFKSNVLFKAVYTLVTFLMIIRVWWAILVPRIGDQFSSSSQAIATLVASIILVLFTAALGLFLTGVFKTRKEPLFGMVCVALIATLLAFTSDRPAEYSAMYFNTETGTAIAKHCPNESCGNPDSPRIFLGDETNFSHCPFCGTALGNATPEVIAAHMAAVKESRDSLFAPFRAIGDSVGSVFESSEAQAVEVRPKWRTLSNGTLEPLLRPGEVAMQRFALAPNTASRWVSVPSRTGQEWNLRLNYDQPVMYEVEKHEGPQEEPILLKPNEPTRFPYIRGPYRARVVSLEEMTTVDISVVRTR